MIRLVLPVIAMSLMIVSSTFASFVGPQSWTRGTGGATYQHWSVFDAYPTDPSPDLGNVNPNGTASLTETTGTGFVTGGGNIYSNAAPTEFLVTIPETNVASPPHNVTAIVQIKTLGSELDVASVKLNGTSAVATQELARLALGGFGGSDVETWFLFNVPYASLDAGSDPTVNLTLTFDAAESSMSLDQLAIDTAIRPSGYYNEPTPVPEPASLALLGFGAWILRRRIRT